MTMLYEMSQSYPPPLFLVTLRRILQNPYPPPFLIKCNLMGEKINKCLKINISSFRIKVYFEDYICRTAYSTKGFFLKKETGI